MSLPHSIIYDNKTVLLFCYYYYLFLNSLDWERKPGHKAPHRFSMAACGSQPQYVWLAPIWMQALLVKSNVSNIQSIAEGAFCDGGRANGQLIISGDASWPSGQTVSFSSFVCPSCLVGPLWRLDRLIPPHASSQPLCLVCMSAFPSSLGAISLSSPGFKSHCLWMLHWSGKNNLLPFCFSRRK